MWDIYLPTPLTLFFLFGKVHSESAGLPYAAEFPGTINTTISWHYHGPASALWATTTKLGREYRPILLARHLISLPVSPVLRSSK